MPHAAELFLNNVVLIGDKLPHFRKAAAWSWDEARLPEFFSCQFTIHLYSRTVGVSANQYQQLMSNIPSKWSPSLIHFETTNRCLSLSLFLYFLHSVTELSSQSIHKIDVIRSVLVAGLGETSFIDRLNNRIKDEQVFAWSSASR